MDGVIADLLTPWISIINEKENESLRSEDIQDWEIAKFTKCKDKIFTYLDYDLFRNLPVMENSQEILKQLHDKYEIYIVTAATKEKEVMLAKWDWLQEHFPFIDTDHMILCGKKNLIHADYMIDDGPHNLKEFKGKSLLFDATYNRTENRFQRVNNWKEIGDLLL